MEEKAGEGICQIHVTPKTEHCNKWLVMVGLLTYVHPLPTIGTAEQAKRSLFVGIILQAVSLRLLLTKADRFGSQHVAP